MNDELCGGMFSSEFIPCETTEFDGWLIYRPFSNMAVGLRATFNIVTGMSLVASYVIMLH